MRNEALAHSAKKTVTFLDKILDKGARLIKWPANSMDLNPILSRNVTVFLLRVQGLHRT